MQQVRGPHNVMPITIHAVDRKSEGIPLNSFILLSC